MKNIYPILLCLLFIGDAATAQDYACILPTQKQYFIDSNHYLRGMRIDSMHISGDTSFYYPFHTPRGNFSQGNTLDTNGASWMGAEIIQLKDGRYWFFNHWGDTVAIQAQARLNDKWIIHHDTNDIYYEAQITAIDTATILGTIDSIKTITITAYDKNGINTSAYANGMQWVLSKQHGFYKLTDTYFFPYHYPGDFAKVLHQYDDYYTYKVGGFHEFSLVDFKNPRLVEVYDYSVGDMMYTLDKPIFSHHGGNIYFYDTVDAVTSIVGGKEYTIRDAYGNRRNLVADSTYLVTEFPEEVRTDYVYHYFYDDTNYCKVEPIIQFQTNQIGHDDMTVNIWLDVLVVTWRYKTGVGLIHHDSWKALSYRFQAFDRNLIYYIINNKDCGLSPLTINNTPNQTIINIYPNPVQGNTVYIDMPNSNSETYHLMVYDAVGKQVMTKTITQATSVDVGQLSTGIYLFEIVGDNERVVKRVTIN